MGIVRLLLALSVFITHSTSLFGISLVNGVMAVEGFFILSGFYMAMVCSEKYASAASFYKNRILRLYPTYLVILVFGIFCGVFFHIGTSWKGLHPLTIFFLGFSNLTIIGQDVLMFLGIQDGLPFIAVNVRQMTPASAYLILSPAWTLGLELWFYLLVPFLAKRKWYVLLTLFLLSLTARYIGYRNGLFADPWNYRYFPFEFAFFLAGMFSYRMYVILRTRNISRFFTWGSFSAIILATLLSPLQIIYYGIIVLCIPLAFILTKNWKADRFIGSLTYPFYLLHVLLLALNNGRFSHLIILPICLALSALVVLAVERPLARFR